MSQGPWASDPVHRLSQSPPGSPSKERPLSSFYCSCDQETSWPSNPGLWGSEVSASETQGSSPKAKPVRGTCGRRRAWHGWGHGPAEDCRPYPCRCLWSPHRREHCGPESPSLTQDGRRWPQTSCREPWAPAPAPKLITMDLEGSLSEPPFAHRSAAGRVRTGDHKPSAHGLSSPPSSVLARLVTSLGLSFSPNQLPNLYSESLLAEATPTLDTPEVPARAISG